MTLPLTILVLFVAALLEAGGDALVRVGLHSGTSFARSLFFLAGAIALFCYGYLVNSPGWSFGDLIGVYVVLFFITAQLISYFFFGTIPSKTTLMGGTFIIAGGVLISIGH